MNFEIPDQDKFPFFAKTGKKLTKQFFYKRHRVIMEGNRIRKTALNPKHYYYMT